MLGGFVLVVGPSGAGKDTLLGLARQALAEDERFLFARRVVTRESSHSEEHDSMGVAEFLAAEAAGRFCLSWQAHGLRYGIPAAVAQAARRGALAICNVSRSVLGQARTNLPGVSVVEVTAPAEVLAARLAARGRGSDADLGARLRRVALVSGPPPELVIRNDGAPEVAAAALLAHLRDRVRAPVDALDA
jgi:ribose 1,5-bisphosphokinase